MEKLTDASLKIGRAPLQSGFNDLIDGRTDQAQHEVNEN
jgi:hypothetical protein